MCKKSKWSKSSRKIIKWKLSKNSKNVQKIKLKIENDVKIEEKFEFENA